MDAGGLAQMSSNTFPPASGLAMSGNLATRRGSQNIKPLSFDAIKQSSNAKDGGVPTPRTSRSHLLAGLRTAPKSANAASFGTANSSVSAQQLAKNSMATNLSGYGQDSLLRNPPLTAFPQYGVQQSGFPAIIGHQQYTVDQVLAPPEITMDEQSQEHMDPNLYAQLVATNMYLAQQQQRLQQQLRSVQAAAQQFQQLNLSNPQLAQQQLSIYEQQQQLRNMQQQLGVQAALGQGQQVYYSPVTGQYYVDSSSMAPPMSSGFVEQQQQQQQQQPMSPVGNAFQQLPTPRVQVSPPPENQPSATFRNPSPPRRYDSPCEVTPLPPPSVNAFRRGHKKTSSLAPSISSSGGGELLSEMPKSAGPKASSFPLTPTTGSYGPGQARAGEHPIRQPRGPPALDELKSKPTAKHEGSKNFASRARRSAVHNLVRAGLERRKGAGSSPGSMSPSSETADDLATPMTDNDSDSGRSGSGILAGEMEYGSSRTPTSGGWGAIGSDRPNRRHKSRSSLESGECSNDSFAAVFKNAAPREAKAHDAAEGQRRASRLVLTSVEKRKATPVS
ncbi:hypothetical protein L249_1146 [Ophiocordyceps polyrhachis-furcata BCC 54312]|uniref:Uncharacterized protein n=1 Tax=Ophiocordyceps polyrhachis-furcata BCC 54312 TaxID=1330021 RepID=A0A367LDX7_9HYPO|nr:hypothetical protein L249_1146 [Ophiocordyceps polyrhachis-furcata BCC 54312]